MKTGIAVLVATSAALLAGQAVAQSCVPAPADKCTARFSNDPNDWIARLIPGFGGQIVCDGIPASTVQYDSYKWSGGQVYLCSLDQTCAWAQSHDPQAYGKFCP